MRRIESWILLSLFALTGARRDYSRGTIYNVCANPWEPLVSCEDDGPVGLDEREFRLISEKLGWKRLHPGESPQAGTQYFQYNCTSVEVLEADLKSKTGTCHFATSLTVTKARLEDGLLFSFPTFRGKLAILTTASYIHGNGWGFLRPVTTGVWVTVLSTGLVVVPLLLLIFEYATEQKRMPRSVIEVKEGMSKAMWKSMTTLLQIEGDSRDLPVEAKIVMLGYAFLVLIIITVYTANMTSNLVVRKISATVSSPDQLRGSKVGALPITISRLEGHGVTNATILEANETTMRDSILGLKSGELDALVMAAPWIAGALAEEGCNNEFYVLNLDLEPYDYALAFPNDIPYEIMKTVNRAIMELSETATLQRQAYDKGLELNACMGDQSEDPFFVFGLRQIYGVWVLMGACIIIGTMISVTRCCLRRHSLFKPPPYSRYENDELEMAVRNAEGGTGNGQAELNTNEAKFGQILLDLQKEMQSMQQAFTQVHQRNNQREVCVEIERPSEPSNHGSKSAPS